MPFANEHSARVRNPEDFQQGSFRRTNVTDGVDLISGKLYNEDTMTAQTYRFDADKFTPDEAKQWCKDNDVKYISFEAAKKAEMESGSIVIKGVIGEDYTFAHALIDLERNKMSSILNIYIDTPGGSYDEGMKMYDLFKASGKLLTTSNIGIVASMGVTLFCVAPKGSRFYDPAKGEFFIHNPWGQPEGDADFLAEAAKQMKKCENNLVRIYSEATGALPETISGLMSIQTSLTPEQVETLGFATITHTELKAVAKLNYNQMTDVELTKKIEEGNDSILQKIVALFKKQGVIKALILKTGDDKNLDFGEEIQEASQIVVGTPATVDGKPAEGDYIMPDGVTYVFEGGKVKEIKPAAPPEDKSEELAKENETLKAQLSEAQATLKSVQEEMTKFKAQITSDIKGFKQEKPVEDPEVVRKPFKNKE